jgi:murein DD-endopeptidase MepM/ murein hydrolase activator NlpD
MMGARWLVAALGVAALGTPAYAQPPIEPSGVTLVAPRDAVCPAIVLPFGVAARYATNRHAARHDGIDFKVPDETPLLAIAAGKVIGLGAGARSTGRYVWIQHAPGDTGLPFWVYTLYQHFDPTPELGVGVVLKVGQVIGSAGQPAYPNLHVQTLVSRLDQCTARGVALEVSGGRVVDPAIVYVTGFNDLGDLDRLSRNRPSVLIPYATVDGMLRPVRSRVIWPIACRPR